jgi:hypothetical protein
MLAFIARRYIASGELCDCIWVVFAISLLVCTVLELLVPYVTELCGPLMERPSDSNNRQQFVFGTSGAMRHTIRLDTSHFAIVSF